MWNAAQLTVVNTPLSQMSRIIFQAGTKEGQ